MPDHKCKRCARNDRFAAYMGAAFLGASLGGNIGAVAMVLFAVTLFWFLDRREEG